MKAHSSRMSGVRMSVKGFLRRVFSFLLLLPIYFYRICISPLTPPSYGVTLGVVPAMILYLKLQNVENGKEYK